MFRSASEVPLTSEEKTKLVEQLKTIFPDNTLEFVHVEDKVNPPINLTFANNIACNVALSALWEFIHPTYAMGDTTFSIVLTPALAQLLGDANQMDLLKQKIDSDYQNQSLEAEKAKKTAAKKPEEKSQTSKADRSIEIALGDLVKDAIPDITPDFKKSPPTASTPYESFRLNIDSFSQSMVDQIRKRLTDNGIPDYLVKYSVINGIKKPVTIIVNDQRAKAYHFYQKGLEGDNKGDNYAAVSGYREAAALNHIKAKTNLAIHYISGTGGLSRDKRKAHDLLLEASTAGHPRAQFNLAIMLEKGDGVQRDLLDARAWYTAALDNGITQASEGLARTNTELVHFDAIKQLFPSGVRAAHILNKDIMIEFDSDQLYSKAINIFKDHLHPGKESNGNKMFLYVTPSLIHKLEDKGLYKKMITALAVDNSVDSKPAMSNVSIGKPSPTVTANRGRCAKFSSEENIDKIKDTLSREGLIVGGLLPNHHNNDKIRNVFDRQGDERFKVHTNKLTTNQSDVELFVTMLNVFKVVHGDTVLPAITTNSDQLKELWKIAFTKVYPTHNSKLDSIITIDTQLTSNPSNTKQASRGESSPAHEANNENIESTRRQLK